MLVLLCGSETMIWGEKERSLIRVVQMDSLIDLLGIRRMNIIPNTQIREMCGLTKVLTDGSALLKE